MKQAFFHALSLRGQIVRREGKGQRMVKMFYLCKLVTVFGRGYGNLSHLFRVPYVASGDRIEATPWPSGSRETMRHTPFRRPPPLVASINQRRLAHFTQFHQHNLSRIIWVRPHRRLVPEDECFRDHHRNMNGLIPSARKGIRGPLPQPARGHKPVAGRAPPQMAPQRFAAPQAAFPRSCRKERRSPGLPPTIL